jgi:hypothetical protein
MPFKKGDKKQGGRAKGTSNNSTSIHKAFMDGLSIEQRTILNKLKESNYNAYLDMINELKRYVQ